MFEQLTDVELLEQYRATGDAVYFGELYGRYVHLLLGMARHFIEDRDVALELVVATYEKLQKKVKYNDIIAIYNGFSLVLSSCLLSFALKKI